MGRTTKIPTSMLDRLSAAPYGAYGIDLDQTIVFWNAQAEAILGYKADEVLGRKCYETVQLLASDGATTVCAQNCPAIVAANRGHIPPVAYVRMQTASGLSKPVTTFPLIVTDDADQLVLIHMFHETPVAGPTADEPMPLPLTPRETEVLGLLAVGLRPMEVAERLFISVHTVRKHIRNASEKLHSHGMMSAVLAAQRRRLI